MKSLTKKLNKGKNIAEAPAKETPRAKLYMGAHVEMDRAAMFKNKWRAQKKERKKPKPSAQQRPAQAENISGRYFTAGNSCKNVSDFPARKQLAVKSASETRLPNALENGRYLLGTRRIINTCPASLASYLPAI
ncbi:hypothetical protein V6N13_122294 [Hibiscus sabdariffa]|uniref:Uncharacterized protein n=1 Tax=Hibiscus sabdariffa TaxID=183260 RepID=A0ABR2NK85_9ROSI